MKTALAVSVLAAGVLAASASASSAAIVYPGTGDLGTFGAAGGSQAFAGSVAGYGNGKPSFFSDTFTFVLTAATKVSASVTNAFINLKGLTDFTLTVNNIQGLTTTAVTSQTATFPPTSAALTFDPGTYKLTVSGYSAKAAETYGGSFIVNAVSTVPLPSSVALFGVALAGLGVAGAVRRKKSAASVA